METPLGLWLPDTICDAVARCWRGHSVFVRVLRVCKEISLNDVKMIDWKKNWQNGQISFVSISRKKSLCYSLKIIGCIIFHFHSIKVFMQTFMQRRTVWLGSLFTVKMHTPSSSHLVSGVTIWPTALEYYILFVLYLIYDVMDLYIRFLAQP